MLAVMARVFVSFKLLMAVEYAPKDLHLSRPGVQLVVLQDLKFERPTSL